MTSTPKQVKPTPDDLATPTVFDGVFIPIAALLEARRLAGRPQIEGLTFRNCVLQGPAVLAPNSETNFNNCNLGDVMGDRRNLFLKAEGPMIIGAIPVGGCLFESCIFIGVGFGGKDSMIEHFMTHLAAGGTPE